MQGRELKAEAVRAGLPLYRVASEAGVNPSRLSKLLNDHEPFRSDEQQRIASAIDRLSQTEPAGAA